jgi:hypothetical protein
MRVAHEHEGLEPGLLLVHRIRREREELLGAAAADKQGARHRRDIAKIDRACIKVCIKPNLVKASGE